MKFTLYSTPLIKINSLSQPKKYKVYISFEQPSPFMAQGFSLGLEYENVQSAKANITDKETGEVHQDVKSDTSTAPKLVGLNLGYKQISR